ncbi:MAG TPA: Mrp/NBP35 family ATP-binding protein, partial [Corynebacterium urealyticum]|nr:Mrp/NBP35 family ATP-binding protein [Corynebacterium urealyticum]
MPMVQESDIRNALSKVEDPELNRSITELGMVKSIDIDGADVAVEIYLTIAGCPMKSHLTEETRKAAESVAGVENVTVTTDVMSDEQRREVRKIVRGDAADPVIPFAQPDSTTRVYAVASGKGGVGK